MNFCMLKAITNGGGVVKLSLFHIYTNSFQFTHIPIDFDNIGFVIIAAVAAKITVRNSVEELLTISQDGFVMLYTITNSALLIGSRQLQIFLNECNIQIPANR